MDKLSHCYLIIDALKILQVSLRKTYNYKTINNQTIESMLKVYLFCKASGMGVEGVE